MFPKKYARKKKHDSVMLKVQELVQGVPKSSLGGPSGTVPSPSHISAD